MPIQLGAPPQHGFDQPLGLLSDCHRRIEHFLGILRKIAEPGSGPLDNQQRDAVEVALTYFRIAAPRHNEDEEQSLFPLLRKRSEPAVVAALEVINSLEAEHVVAASAHKEVDRLYRQWIAAGALPDPERLKLEYVLDELIQMYQRHIAVEDKNIFPLAAQMLDVEDRGRLGREMAERRGIKITQHPSAKPKGDIKMTAKNTIDVRTIPGPQRHPLIFKTFEALHPGEALELINDHDPFPLQKQFNFMKRGQFGWDYLQEGPDIWRVRISKVQPHGA